MNQAHTVNVVCINTRIYEKFPCIFCLLKCFFFFRFMQYYTVAGRIFQVVDNYTQDHTRTTFWLLGR